MTKDEMIWDFTTQINHAVEYARFQRTDITYDDHFKMRFHKSTHSIQIVITYGWLHEDNRWHRASKSEQFTLDAGTANRCFLFVMKTVHNMGESNE